MIEKHIMKTKNYILWLTVFVVVSISACSSSNDVTTTDTTPPTLAKIFTKSSLSSESSLSIGFPLNKDTPDEVIFYFSENIDGFTTNDIELSGVIVDKGKFITNSKKEYTWEITPKKQGTLSIKVLANSFRDISGIYNTIAFSTNFLIGKDINPPTLKKISTKSPLKENASGNITFTFSEDITNFEKEDIYLSGVNVDKGKFITNSKKEYTWEITPRESGVLNINIPVNSFKDLTNNFNTTAFSTNLLVIDTSPPKLIKIITNSLLRKDISGKITFVFNEEVRGFRKADIKPSGTKIDKDDFFTSTSPKEYIWRIVPREVGYLKIVVPTNSFVNAVNKLNTIAFSNEFWVKETTPPTLTISTNSPLKENNLGVLTFTFSEEVTNFTTNDINLSGLLVDKGNFVTNSKKNYTWEITPRGYGSLKVEVPTRSFSDTNDNENTTTFSINLSVEESTPPVLTNISAISTLDNNVLGGEVAFHFYFSEEVTGFTTSDIHLLAVNVDKGDFITNSKKEYTWKITPKRTGFLSIQVTVNSFKDLVGNFNTNDTSTNFLVKDVDPPTVNITTALDLAESVEGKIIFNFSEDVINFEKSDIKFEGISLPTVGEFIVKSKKSYELKVTPTIGLKLTVTIDANSFKDLSGNFNQAISTELAVLYSKSESSLRKMARFGCIWQNIDINNPGEGGPGSPQYSGLARQISDRYYNKNVYCGVNTGPVLITKYVREGGTGDGSSWANASGNPKALIESITDASRAKVYLLLVAAGEYLSDNIAMKNYVIIVGGWDPNKDWKRIGSSELRARETRFSGQNKYRVFRNINIGSKASFYDITITEGKFDDYGGAGMYNKNSSPYLKNVIFSDNRARSIGGGMFNEKSFPTLDTVSFSKNNAEYGGGMYNSQSSPRLNNVTFSENKAKHGGGMYNDNKSSPTVYKVIFSNNKANIAGGGMYNDSKSSPRLNTVTFSENNALGVTGEGSGGGMYNNQSSPELRNVTFSENKANFGGGMYNYNSSPGLNSVTFSENKVEYGGGMYNDNKSSPRLITVIFSNNKANIAGGGMYNYNESSPKLHTVTFSENNALGVTGEGSGGGMYNYNSSPILIVVTFSENKAKHGGGMYNASSSPTLVKATFSENRADNLGAGIYNLNSSPILLTVVLSKNRANINGGGMYNWKSSSLKLSNVTFSENEANFGGGMYNLNSSPKFENVIFSENKANYSGGGMLNRESSPKFENVIFSENKANYSGGGGMYNYIDSSPNLENVTFISNVSSGYYGHGGGMLNKKNSSPTLNNVIFSENTANASGGGMFNKENSSPTLNKVTFSENKANYGGGLITGSALTLVNVTFSKNKASHGGGGIFTANNSLNSVNVTFSENQAGYKGGGIYFSTKRWMVGTPLLVNTIFWGNKVNKNANQVSFENTTDKLSLHYSIIQGGTNNLDGTLTSSYSIGDNPLLSSSLTNDGLVQTYALGAGSPAINAGVYVKKSGDTLYFSTNQTAWYTDFDNQGFSGTETTTGSLPSDTEDINTTDARGYIRSDQPDIGAFEYGATAD